MINCSSISLWTEVLPRGRGWTSLPLLARFFGSQPDQLKRDSATHSIQSSPVSDTGREDGNAAGRDHYTSVGSRSAPGGGNVQRCTSSARILDLSGLRKDADAGLGTRETRLPEGESVHLGGVTLVEAFTPSTVFRLYETLRKWPGLAGSPQRTRGRPTLNAAVAAPVVDGTNSWTCSKAGSAHHGERVTMTTPFRRESRLSG